MKKRKTQKKLQITTKGICLYNYVNIQLYSRRINKNWYKVTDAFLLLCYLVKRFYW